MEAAQMLSTGEWINKQQFRWNNLKIIILLENKPDYRKGRDKGVGGGTMNDSIYKILVETIN